MSTRSCSCAASRRYRFGGGDTLGRAAGAQRLEFGHRIEHAGESLRAWPRHDGAAMGGCIDETAGGKLPYRLAYRRARHAEAVSKVRFIECSTRPQNAAHDLICELKAKLLSERRATTANRGNVQCFRIGRVGRSRHVPRPLSEQSRRHCHGTPSAGWSIMLTCAATMRQPSSKRIQVCICRPTLPGAVAQ